MLVDTSEQIQGIRRRSVLGQLAGLTLLTGLAGTAVPAPKLLMVVAHPDDEYMFAAATYRLVHELGWIADQVIITNGESGYRYSSLAQAIYKKRLDEETDGRINLPAIRKAEVLRAGKILGTRRHYFLDQKDLGFSDTASNASAANWDQAGISHFLANLLEREHYDLVFTILPTAETHGHHRSATRLALQAVAAMPEKQRPMVFGAEACSQTEGTRTFAGFAGDPLTATFTDQPTISFDRTASFGYHHALNYQIVVNWVIAEHKSQGLFQTDAGKHQFERFWLFQASGAKAVADAARLRSQLVVK